MQELLTSLKNVEHKVAPSLHATVLLMPTQTHMKGILDRDPTIENRAMVAQVRIRAGEFVNWYMGAVQTASGLTLSDALDLYEDFHILEALPQRWSPYHMFKCNCPCCFKTASCAHVLLASMLCDKRIEVPMQYVDGALQYRRRGPGRPTAKGKGRSREEKAVAELKSREKSGLDTQRHKYKVPTVSVWLAVMRPPLLMFGVQQGIEMEMCSSDEEDAETEVPRGAKKVLSPRCPHHVCLCE